MRRIRYRPNVFSVFCLVGTVALVLTAIHARPLLAQIQGVNAVSGDAVKDVDTFINCLNKNLDGQKGVDISNDAVTSCLPKGCTFTLTMSPASAQAACTLGGCQLPRVIFDCPGTGDMKKFRPSFLLCPLNSKSGNRFGTDRIEIGEDTKANGEEMKMADVPIPPGEDYQQIDINAVLSRKGANTNKKCNACHASKGNPGDGDPLLSGKIDNFEKEFENGDGQKFDLSGFPIFSSDPRDKDKVNPNTKKDLETVCNCILNNADAIATGATSKEEALTLAKAQKKIDQNKKLADLTDDEKALIEQYLNDKLKPGTLGQLCKNLLHYAQNRQCGIAQPGDAPGLACAGLRGGGKFIGFMSNPLAVSTVRLDISGNITRPDATAFTFLDTEGDLSAFNYTTRTLISSTVISSLQGSVFSPSIIDVVAQATALVTTPLTPGGVLTPITLNMTKRGSVVTVEVRNGTTGALLAGGGTEPAFPERTALELNVTAP